MAGRVARKVTPSAVMAKMTRFDSISQGKKKKKTLPKKGPKATRPVIGSVLTRSTWPTGRIGWQDEYGGKNQCSSNGMRPRQLPGDVFSVPSLPRWLPGCLGSGHFTAAKCQFSHCTSPELAVLFAFGLGTKPATRKERSCATVMQCVSLNYNFDMHTHTHTLSYTHMHMHTHTCAHTHIKLLESLVALHKPCLENPPLTRLD